MHDHRFIRSAVIDRVVDQIVNRLIEFYGIRHDETRFHVVLKTQVEPVVLREFFITVHDPVQERNQIQTLFFYGIHAGFHFGQV